MDNSRRGFLRKGTFGALGATVALGLADNALGLADNALGLADKGVGHEGLSSTAPRLALDKAAFQAQLKTTFFIGLSRTPIKLIEVVDLGSKRLAKSPREAFSLTFRGDDASPLQQQTYMIDHEKLGMFSMLIVPIVSKDKSARYYEAVINRLHP